MLDAFIMKRLRTPLRAMGTPLASVGITATQLTVIGACFDRVPVPLFEA